MNFELIKPINPDYSAIEQVFTNRGFELEDIPHYLNVTKEDNLSPLLLNNIDAAIKMLLKHLREEDGEVLLCVDCDCDGYTSAALLLNYIYRAFPSTIDKIRYVLHDNKQHGIMYGQIREDTKLVIAPDASSNEYDIHQALYEKGIDVLVIDHHHADKVSKYACVVNNQLDNYPNKTLSGVGVVYKVCQRMDELLGTEYAEELIDLAAVGIVGDMVDLRSMETRYIVQDGMRNFRNPFLVAMHEKNEFSLGKELTPIGIAFYIVPFVNAMTRSGTIEEKQILFESMLDWKAHEKVSSTKRGEKGQEEEIVTQAIRTCINVKKRQTDARDKDTEAIEEIIQKNNLLSQKLLIIKAEGLELNRNVVGLIANELMSKYQRPTALLSRVEKEDGIYWEGSARGYSGPQIADFRAFCEQSGLVVYAQGHANACGLSIRDENIEHFIAYSEEQLKDIEFTPSYKVDFIYNSRFNPRAILDLGEMRHVWGQEIAEPMFALEHIEVTSDMVTLMSRNKSPTLKIQLPNGVACIKFKSSEEEYQTFVRESGCVIVNIIGRPEVNRYYEKVTPQLIITDYEITGYQEYYF